MVGFLLGAQLVDSGEFRFVDEVDFTTEQGLDAVFFCLLKEARQAVEHTVVGD